MCSVGDDNYDTLDASKYMPCTNNFKWSENKCNKCRENAPCVVLRSKDAYCKDCFLTGTVHKFKSFLGKHRVVKPNDKVLVDFRDGHPSTALLHFIRTGLDLNTPKKLRFQPRIIYIEDNFDSSETERCETLKSAKQIILSSDFPVYFVSLKDYILNPDDLSALLQTNEKNLVIKQNDFEVMHSKINKMATKTNKIDILSIYRKRLLTSVAKLLNCSTIFTTELAADTASQLLTNVSLGRGIHLPLDVGISDCRDPEVTVLRPLRLFDIKELALYNYFYNLDPLLVPRKSENPYASVQSLMKNFVHNLQTNYPATVTTIVRTGDKLALDKTIVANELCQLCNASKENRLKELGSAESTKFSHCVSTNEPDYSLPPIDRFNETLKSFDGNSTSNYCFACDRLVKDLLNQ